MKIGIYNFVPCSAADFNRKCNDTRSPSPLPSPMDLSTVLALVTEAATDVVAVAAAAAADDDVISDMHIK